MGIDTALEGIGAVGGAVGSIFGANEASSAAEDAANAQKDSAAAGIAEQRRQFDLTQKLFSPYVKAGEGALTSYQDLAGLNGAQPQQGAITALENSPEMTAYIQQGENALLQNASATGGLRGGNLQAALAKFRPQLLAEMINQQYGRYGNLLSLGQSSAAGTGNAGLQSANSVSNLLGQSGAAQAGSYLAQGKANADLASNLSQGYGDWMAKRQFDRYLTKIGAF